MCNTDAADANNEFLTKEEALKCVKDNAPEDLKEEMTEEINAAEWPVNANGDSGLTRTEFDEAMQ